MKTKYNIGDLIFLNDDDSHEVMAIQAYLSKDIEIISYKLSGLSGWIHENTIKEN